MRRGLMVFLVAAVVVLSMGGDGRCAVAADSSWQCWGPGLPDPCRNTLHDISIDPNSGRIWAVGDAGTILYWNGSEWLKQGSPVGANLRGVAAESAHYAWAVGLDGTVLRRAGESWQEKGPSSSDWFRAVALVPGTDAHAWAVGDKYGIGAFHYWNGTSWQGTYAGNRQWISGSIWDMSILGSQSGWAVGSVLGTVGSGVGMVGQLLPLGAGGWGGQHQVPEELYGVAMRTDSDGWAVGEDGAIYRWNGSAWTKVEAPTGEDLRDVCVVNASDAWIVGEFGTILHWNGAVWSSVPCPGGYHDLQAVAFAGPSKGWAVGEGGTILRWDGATWSVLYAPVVSRLDSICMTPGTGGRDGWAVGNNRTILHWNGVDWTAMEGPYRSYYDVSFASPDVGWLSGSRTFCRRVGAGWDCMARDDSGHVLATLSANDVWAAGWGVIQHWDGQSWSNVHSPTNRTLYDMDALSPNEIWASGDSGTLIHYDGQAWHASDASTTTLLPGIGVAAPDDVWAGGSSGKLLHYDGQKWTESERVVWDTIWDVDVLATGSGTIGWAVGSSGAILRLMGGIWTQVASPTANTIRNVCMVDAQSAWAVGDGGMIMYYGPLPALDTVRLPLVMR